jgi:hypothetical protein
MAEPAESDAERVALALFDALPLLARTQAVLSKRGLAVVIELDAERQRITVTVGDPADPTMPAPPPRRWLAGGHA